MLVDPIDDKPNSGWIRLAQAGFALEVLVFVSITILSLITASLLHFNNLVSLVILVFGFNKVFWNTVHRLAEEDALELGIQPFDQ